MIRDQNLNVQRARELENLTIDLSVAFDAAAQRMLDAHGVTTPLARQRAVERAIAYLITRTACEASAPDCGVDDICQRIQRQAAGMIQLAPVVAAIHLCAPRADDAGPCYVTDWLRARCVRRVGASINCMTLRDLYVEWCGEKEQQILPLSRQAFSDIVTAFTGVGKIRHGDGVHYLGIELRKPPAAYRESADDRVPA